MFVDACALVAVFAEEPEAAAYEKAIDAAATPWTSAFAAFEATLVLARHDKLNVDFGEALESVLIYLRRRGVALRELGTPEAVLRNAVSIADRNGVSRKSLSVFDCFHYACAKTAGQPLLTLDRLLRDSDVQTLP